MQIESNKTMNNDVRMYSLNTGTHSGEIDGTAVSFNLIELNL